MIITDDNLDNVLVSQKNRILRLINDGMVSEAQASLDTVRGLWESCGYGYKYRETSERIMQSIRVTLAG